MPWGAAAASAEAASEWTTTADAYNGFTESNGGSAGNRMTSKHDGISGAGASGHSYRQNDIAEPAKQMTGECFNCGEIGHNKADCPNPKVERPFTGTCRVCNEEGHRASECPTKPAEICRNCQMEGHKAAECDQARAMDLSKVPEMSEEEAMKLLADAAGSRDTDQFKTGVKVLVKGNPELTYVNIETKIRAAGLDMYLVALECEPPKTFTYVDLQGKSDRKYKVAYMFNPKPRRMRTKSEYPTSTEENLERLVNSGEAMRQMVPVCLRCNELGHTSKNCEMQAVPPPEDDAGGRVCNNCGEPGHYSRDCTGTRVDKSACRNCGQSGHKSTECPEPRSAAGVECRICNETGHFARDCPEKGEGGGGGGGGGACRNCGEEGHFAKECEKPRDPSTITCRNCDEVGHMSRDCPKPRDYSRVQCKQCGEMGHTVARCPGTKQASGDSGDGGGPGEFDAPSAAPAGELNTDTPFDAPAGDWNIDNGGDSSNSW